MGIVVPTAVLTALVLIAAGANQWASKQMGKADHEPRLYLAGWLTYSWRFTRGPELTRYWAGQLALIGTVLVLTALLVWALLRGPITWGRAFFGTWLAVLFATVAGAFVRGLIAPDDFARLPGASRVTNAAFGPYGPNGFVVFGGLVLGLLVAALTSLVAVTSRRAVAPAAPVPASPPMFADYAPPPPTAQGTPPPWQDKHYGPPAGDQPTTQLPPAERSDPALEPGQRPGQPPADQPEKAPDGNAERPDAQPTTQLPPPPAGPPSGPPSAPPSGPPAAPPAGEQATTRFPRPPDDEDLGHIEH